MIMKIFRNIANHAVQKRYDAKNTSTINIIRNSKIYEKVVPTVVTNNSFEVLANCDCNTETRYIDFTKLNNKIVGIDISEPITLKTPINGKKLLIELTIVLSIKLRSE